MNSDSIKFYQNLIQQLSELILVMDKESRFIFSNEQTAKLFGYKKESELQGLNAHDMRCPAVESAPHFIEQDKYVISEARELVVLDIHTYATQESKILLTKKKPFYEEGDLVGLICHCTELNPQLLNRVISTLVNLDKRYHPQGKKDDRSFTIDTTLTSQLLTKRELDCIFYMIRGKTMKEVAAIIHASARTVEKHIENIKLKLDLNSRSQIVEYAIKNGFLDYIPSEILNTELSQII